MRANTDRSQNIVTIIVPTLNEEGNIAPLLKRINSSMNKARLSYKVLFIDDHSKDGTASQIKKLVDKFPIHLELKKGRKGKAQSIIEGLESAKTNFVCMIDADLQYPPEDIPKMIRKLIDNNADVVLSKRIEPKTSFIRKFASSAFHLVFIQWLYGIDYDTQSGLKVFRRSAFTNMKLRPSPWAFDLEFIINCLMRNKKILTHDILFGARNSGEAKVSVIKTSIELARSSIELRKRVSGKEIRMSYNNNLLFSTRVARMNE